MIGALLALAMSRTVVPTVYLPPFQGDPCAKFAKPPAEAGDAKRLITLDDQVSMANIGRADPNRAPSSFGISPDRQHIAFLVTRANAAANAFCRQLLVAPMSGQGNAIEIDRGGQFIRDDFSLRDFAAIKAGWDKPDTPRWSPDGTHVAFLKREDNSTQVWIADATGREPARQVTHLPDDVDDFAWAPDGKSLVVSSRPGLRLAATAIAQEGLRGFLYDDRFSPQFADRPIPTGTIPFAYSWVSPGEGASRPAKASERALLDPPHPAEVPKTARQFRPGPAGYAAWLEPKFPAHILSPTRIVMADDKGQRQVCDRKSCEGVINLWWAPKEHALYIARLAGWAHSQMALLRWDIGESAPKQIVISNDVFIGCASSGEELVCEREGSLQTRRLVAIDMHSGRQRIIYDPNPLFQHLRLGPVQRFYFRNSYGVESYADLVLPPDHKPGQKYPLVVVQYISFGFLRGGTGDEVPVQPLAARGFAVLSFQRPDLLPAAYTATTEAQMRSAMKDKWADRRQVESSLEMAIQRAIATGAVDPTRMGISGHSDGSSTAQFALVNSHLFKAASLGSCCEDMYTFALAAGPYFTDFLRTMGYRYFDPGEKAFWTPMSLILNIDKVNTPILIQTGDSEYEGGLDVVEDYRHHHKAIEMHVFPNEPHFKWQPAHRAAMYDRVVDWFAFWLQHSKDCSAAKDARYRRWQAMSGAPSPASLRCRNGASPTP